MAPIVRVLVASCFLFSVTLKSQNLVRNGSFELLTECPKAVSSLAKNGIDLSSPTSGTTDLFSTCSTGKVSIPKNFRGRQDAHSGDAYAGLYLYSPNDYREYIQLRLDTVLEKDMYYELTLYVSLAESSTVSTNALNVLLTDDAIVMGTSKNLSKSRLRALKNHRFQFQKLEWKGSSRDDSNWVPVQVRFKARGFEKHLILGNFSSDELTNRYKTENFRSTSKEFAYYYIDGITMVESDHQPLELGEAYVIDGVRFDTDSYELSTLAKSNIEKLYKNVKGLKHKIKITINGHTDDMGSDGHNEFLSYKRARAVATYLVELGFPNERIVWKGHGNRKPLISKMTDDARLKNRRVDFVITDFEDQ